MHPQPALHQRVTALNQRAPHSQGRFVLYWMLAQRRTRANHALQRAAAWAHELGRPLLVLEALRADYEHASDRFHRFVLDGMADNAASCRKHGVRYLRYVEPRAGAGRGLLAALAQEAAVVVTDDHPVSFFPAFAEHAGRISTCLVERVDACGIYPIRATPKAFATAYAFRRFLQNHLPDVLDVRPAMEPLAKVTDRPAAVVPREVLTRWPELRAAPGTSADDLGALPIDHDVAPTGMPGGARAARKRLAAFVADKLPRYPEDRNHPDAACESGLSPYLHFGHIGAYEVFAAVTRSEGWSTDDLDAVANGRRAGWWGMSEPAESFLDQLITWRELGFNTCVHEPNTYADLASLPDWAKRTLAAHQADERPHRYDLETLENATTHDEVWNVAQAQLRQEGVMHNYLRMNWGKRILEWSETPQEALEHLIHLNDKYALDGRDPNSYSGILWCLGRHDRPWGPERPIFGTVRYMSSERTRAKLRMKAYLERFGAAARKERQGRWW